MTKSSDGPLYFLFSSLFDLIWPPFDNAWSWLLSANLLLTLDYFKSDLLLKPFVLSTLGELPTFGRLPFDWFRSGDFDNGNFGDGFDSGCYSIFVS